MQMLNLLKCLDKLHKQHLKIDQLIDDLEEISGHSFDFDFDRIDITVSDVLKYTREHFHDEEDIMRKLDYPKIDAHIKQHHSLIDTINKLCYGKTHFISDPTENLIHFFRENVAKHIAIEDEYLDEFIREIFREAVNGKRK